MTPMIPLTVLIAAVGLVGAFLLGVGWRGRRTSDHPHCRKCGFDLFALPSDSTRCPECGRDLAQKRAIVIGVRAWRRRHAWVGITLLVPALAVGVALIVSSARGVDWQKHKPDWWLAREASGTVAVTRDAALKELLLRLKAGELSDGRVRQLV